MRRIHREFSLSQSHKTFHDAVAFVLGAQPPMGEEHELQRRRERVNQQTKFTFFHLCKKFGAWLLSGTVTCKLMNEFGSNFDRKGLKDGTCQQ